MIEEWEEKKESLKKKKKKEEEKEALKGKRPNWKIRDPPDLSLHLPIKGIFSTV